MKAQLNIELEGQTALDVGILLEYGFDFERNIADMLHDVAEQLRRAKNETTKND